MTISAGDPSAGWRIRGGSHRPRRSASRRSC